MHTSQLRVQLRVALLLLLGLCLLQCGTALVDADFKIVGGQTTTINTVPYLINLRRNGRFVCGGTLVTHRHVVTAAHCVFKDRPRELRIVAGATTLTGNGHQSRVRKIFLPRGWSPRSLNNDVAVLQLRHAVYGPNVQPIGLCQRSPRPRTRVKISGWGTTSDRTNRVSFRVRSVTVPVIAKSRCRSMYRGRVQLSRSMICAGVPGRKDSCSGDSGGPLISGNRLCGVVSFGDGCAEPNSPGIYTNIMRVRRFILASIRKR